VESVENSKTKSEFSTLSTGLGNPARAKTPDFHTIPSPGLLPGNFFLALFSGS
jgi:hypothetical protein